MRTFGVLKRALLWVFVSAILVNFGFSAELKGYYITHIGDSGRQSIVEFFEKNGKFYSYGFANVDGSEPKKDIKNPDPILRERYDKGAVFVYGLKKDEKKVGVYVGGMVYNYDNGKTYNLKITQDEKSGNLTLRASIDKSGFMGETLVWRRLNKEEEDRYLSQKPDFNVVLESFNTLPKAYQ